MRTRIITSPSFTGDKVLGAILFENTMDREIEGMPTAKYLWEKKQVIPFIKVDKGLAPEENGVQVMKPMPQLDELLKKSVANNVFGTKMRSVIKKANAEGIQKIVDQQFQVGKQIIDAGLVPILEPEVDITSPEKEEIESLLNAALLKGMEALRPDDKVMIKVSIPTKTNLYKDLIAHPKCVRVVALSGGYAKDEANKLLAMQTGMIASFSRALAEGLSYGQSADEFNATLKEAVESIYQASIKG